jgi:glycerophosphoryl diester phosphodiesterase
MKTFVCGIIALSSAMLPLWADSAAVKPEIVGHRGASFDAPENTLSSFKLGYEQKADGCELDIHLTKDGKVVVIHDYDTKRIGGVDKKVVDQTLAEIRELSAADFGKWKGQGLADKFPTLDEVLSLIPPGKKLFIEIKVHEEILPELGRILARSKQTPEQLPIITFYYEVAKAAKAQFPNHEVYWLHSWSKDPKTGQFPEVKDLIKKAKEAHLDGLDLQSGFPIDKEFVGNVHQASLKLITWTVDDPDVARREKAAGVDGITTNRPEWLREQLAKVP